MKKLLIAIDGSANDEASLKSAMLVARRLDADLSVVFTVLPSQSVYVAGGPDSVMVLDTSGEAAVAAKRARAAYDAVCAEEPGTDWSTTNHQSAGAIENLGPLADLVIIERLSEEEGPSAAALNAALFDGAGPVLITPREPPAAIATRPVIVWNASRQSAMAVKSAIPFLTLAGGAMVLAGDDVSPESSGALEKYLDAYGVTINIKHFPSADLTARGRARAILAAADDYLADLMVMGAYGTNAIGALFGLGRATRKIVTAARVPILLHH
jgi:nucleotide-binding universal stress UspA family protein